MNAQEEASWVLRGKGQLARSWDRGSMHALFLYDRVWPSSRQRSSGERSVGRGGRGSVAAVNGRSVVAARQHRAVLGPVSVICHGDGIRKSFSIFGRSFRQTVTTLA